jgi:3-hydroxyisobutyrate dehydrogenase-like beta-hydroxyacid dehydrogenase
MTTAPPDQLSTAVVGLGLLGAPIARHIMRAGHPVVGIDTNRDRTASASAVGIPIARSVAEAASAARVAVSVLPSVEALYAVCAQLVECRDRRVRFLVEASTLPAEAKRRASATLSAVGITLLDCPIIGSSAQAHTRDVVVCASGPRAALDEVCPVLDAFSRRVEYLGELGAGTRMKMIANHLVTLHNAATAEALTLAERIGVDPDVAVRTLAGTGAGSRQLELRGPLMASGTYGPPTATVATFVKDVELITELATHAGSPTPLLHAAAMLYRFAQGVGFRDCDSSAVHAIYAQLPIPNIKRTA